MVAAVAVFTTACGNGLHGHAPSFVGEWECNSGAFTLQSGGADDYLAKGTPIGNVRAIAEGDFKFIIDDGAAIGTYTMTFLPNGHIEDRYNDGSGGNAGSWDRTTYSFRDEQNDKWVAIWTGSEDFIAVMPGMRIIATDGQYFPTAKRCHLAGK